MYWDAKQDCFGMVVSKRSKTFVVRKDVRGRSVRVTIGRRQSWARLLRRILEVDPLLCPRCQVEMKIVSVITDPVVVDAILRQVDQGGGHDPHAPRAPPAA